MCILSVGYVVIFFVFLSYINLILQIYGVVIVLSAIIVGI